MGDLRCLTIRAPWADLIAYGVKRWECRSWRTDFRGPIAIHAGKADTDRDMHLHPEAWAALGDVIGGDAPTRGAVVAVADLTDCLPIVSIDDESHDPPLVEVCPAGLTWWQARDYWHHESDERDISDQLPYGYWESNSWAWRLENVRRIPSPIEARGRLGLWRPDDELVAAIEAALPETTP